MKQLYLLPVLLLALAACRKNNAIDHSPAGCISQQQRNNFGIKAADSLQAVTLFQQNNIKYDNLAFERLILNDTITNTGGTVIYNLVVVIQYIDGLPILTAGARYHFKDGASYLTSGNIYTSINLDAHPTQKLPLLSHLYISETKKRSGPGATYANSCLVARFGYFNLHSGTADNSPSFTKVWRVMTQKQLLPGGDVSRRQRTADIL